MDKIGEVIEASTGEFTAQSYRLHWAPALGSLVKTGAPAPRVGEVHESPLRAGEPAARVGAIHESPLLAAHLEQIDQYTHEVKMPAIYGVVCYSETVSLEPGRRAVARGRDLESEEDVYLQNPQLARLLCTNFKALIVGYQDGDRTCHFLPPRPPHVHAFVFPCSQEEVAAFTSTLDFLNILLDASLPIPTDELVAACLRIAAASRNDGRAFLVGAGKELAQRLAAEPTRLGSLLRKIRP